MGNYLKKRELAKELTQPQIDLIKLNTNYTDAEIKAWYKDFYEISEGKHLSQSDFIKYYKELLPYRGNCEDFCKLVFQALDKDESESLDFSEIIIGFTILANGDLDQRLRWMFNMYDSNRDEFIDYKELKTAVRAILIMTDKSFTRNASKLDEITQTLLKNLDKNNDSKINYEEFSNATKHNDILNNLLCPRYIGSFFNNS